MKVINTKQIKIVPSNMELFRSTFGIFQYLLHSLQSVFPSVKIDQINFIKAQLGFLRVLNEIVGENLIWNHRVAPGGYFTQTVSEGDDGFMYSRTLEIQLSDLKISLSCCRSCSSSSGSVRVP